MLCLTVRCAKQCVVHPVLQVTGVPSGNVAKTLAIPLPFHVPSTTWSVSVCAAPAREPSSCATGLRLSRKSFAARSNRGLARTVSCVFKCAGVHNTASVMIDGTLCWWQAPWDLCHLLVLDPIIPSLASNGHCSPGPQHLFCVGSETLLDTEVRRTCAPFVTTSPNQLRPLP